MKWVGLLAALAFLTLVGMSRGEQAEEPWAIIISGDTAGYLSPCGCTKPMTGGIRRRATAINQFRQGEKTLVLDTGQISGGAGRQHEIKAETVAEILGRLKVDAMNLTREDVQAGLGNLAALQRLSGDAFVSANVPDPGLGGYLFAKSKVPFLISGIDPRLGPYESKVKEFVNEAQISKTVPILMTTGDEKHARELAEKFNGLRLIIYRSTSQVSDQPIQIGYTTLVSPGEKGKAVIKLSWTGSGFSGYVANHLSEEVPNDPAAQESFSTYLSRVKAEKLLDMKPRTSHDAFAGSKACQSCHQREYDIWAHSKHAEALKTLEKDGHDFDPDCVSCHVVGLDSTKGFKSRDLTPLLTDVGCESCHGPATEHVMKPKKHPLPKAGEKSCSSCHNLEHSPTFDFVDYWRKIKH
ncbi:MAG: hypothetical protein KDC26_02925 [Armatimonadetes bacterium]|nr:hypothetical protein [Armatimonadota bacterium]